MQELLIKQKRDEYTTLYLQAEEIRKKYDGKMEAMSSTEEEEYDKTIGAADTLASEIEKMQKEDKREAIAKRLQTFSTEITSPMRHGSPRTGTITMDAGRKHLEDLKYQAYRKYLVNTLPQDQDPVNFYANSTEYKAYLGEIQKMDPRELKAYQADDPTGGGFMQMPQQLAAEVLTLMKDYTFVRELSNVITLERAESLGIPAIDTDPSDDDWTSELGTGSAESTMAFGKRELRPSPLAKRILVSKTLIRKVPNYDSTILDRLSYKMAITQEKAFLLGTGSNQPLGVFTATADGIPTTRDNTNSGTGSTSVIVGDDVVATFYNLKAQYRRRATWIMNRVIIASIRKLKGSTGDYLWQPGMNGFVAVGTGLIGATPETLMSRPICESEYAPSTQTTGLYWGVLGDFSKYQIVDALNMTIQVLYELYAATNQLGYILRSEVDAMPLLGEAFTRGKFA